LLRVTARGGKINSQKTVLTNSGTIESLLIEKNMLKIQIRHTL